MHVWTGTIEQGSTLIRSCPLQIAQSATCDVRPIGVGGEFLSSDERGTGPVQIHLCIGRRHYPDPMSIDCLKSPVIDLCSAPCEDYMIRKTLLAAIWGILLLFGADHAFAKHLRRHS